MGPRLAAAGRPGVVLGAGPASPVSGCPGEERADPRLARGGRRPPGGSAPAARVHRVGRGAGGAGAASGRAAPHGRAPGGRAGRGPRGAGPGGVNGKGRGRGAGWARGAARTEHRLARGAHTASLALAVAEMPLAALSRRKRGPSAGPRSPALRGRRKRDSDAGSRTPDGRGSRARPGSGEGREEPGSFVAGLPAAASQLGAAAASLEAVTRGRGEGRTSWKDRYRGVWDSRPGSAGVRSWAWPSLQ